MHSCVPDGTVYRAGSNSPRRTNYFTPCAGELILLGSLRGDPCADDKIILPESVC